MIDIEKFICSLIEKTGGLNTHVYHCDLLNALKDQGLEYKDGKIVKTQRRIAAEAKEAIFDDEDERIRKALISGVKQDMSSFQTIYGIDLKKVLAWLEKQKYTQRDVDNAYLKGVTDTKNVLENQGEQVWSEEDEDNLRFSERHFKTLLTNTYYDTFCNWLKSLKQRLGGK